MKISSLILLASFFLSACSGGSGGGASDVTAAAQSDPGLEKFIKEQLHEIEGNIKNEDLKLTQADLDSLKAKGTITQEEYELLSQML